MCRLPQLRTADRARQDLITLVAIAALAVVGLVVPSAAKASFLDDSFGSGGIVGLDAQPNDVVVDRSGRTLVALDGNGSIVVAAFDETGEPDASFGVDGVATVDLEHDATATALAVDPANRVVVAASHAQFQGVVVRLTPAGDPDPAYDGDGVDFTNARIGGVLAQPDSKVVIAGVSPEKTLRFARYTAAGDRDTSFGNGGAVSVDPEIPSHWGLAGGEVALGPDGTLVALANANPAFQPNYVAVLAAVTSGGNVITSFGTSEVPGVSQDHSYGSVPSGVAIRPDGRIHFGASSLLVEGEPRNREAQAVGLIANGTRDPAWSSGSGVAGWAEAGVFPPSGDFRATDMQLMSNGRIVIAGIADASPPNPGDEALAIARLLPNGELDPSFGLDGVAWTAYPGQPGGVDAALEIDSLGRPVVTAVRQAAGGTEDAVLIRFLQTGGTPEEGGGDDGGGGGGEECGNEGQPSCCDEENPCFGDEGEGDVAGGASAKMGLRVHKVAVPKTIKGLIRRGVRVLASCDRRCKIVVKVEVSDAVASRLGLSRVRIARGSASAGAAKRRWVVARLSGVAARAFASYGGGGRLRIKVRAAGPGARSATVTVAG